MNSAQDYLTGLSQLHELANAEERRAVWRQGLAALAAVANHQPAPLEGLSPAGLLASARVALNTGLVDDVEFLSKAVAATALFELAAALPQGAERRDLGRRVSAALYGGDGLTFASVARALALGVPRALGEAPVQARVALALQLPIGADAGVDALALALISRPELEREWLSGPSAGPLAARRLAARLVERAACEAARRAREGSQVGLRAFERPSVRAAWARLLADRESLVWRHLATARGVLISAVPSHAEEIARALSPRNGPAEWRRGATSLAASIAREPAAALARCRELMSGEIGRRDPGVKMSLVYGLSRAGEEEPEAAEALMDVLAQTGEIDVIEALVELRRQRAPGDFGAQAAAVALGRLRASRPVADDGLVALWQALIEELEADNPVRPRSIDQQLAAGLQAFAEGRDVRPWAEAALATANRVLGELEAGGDNHPEARLRAFRAVRQLETGLLETSTLASLLTACGADGRAGGAEALESLLARLHEWICKREERPLAAGDVPNLTLRLRRMRALLHVLDVDARGGVDEGGGPARARRLRTFGLLLGRVQEDPPSALRRITCAALARACDGLVRDDMGELSDVLIATLVKVRGADDLTVLAEASMVAELQEVLRAAADLARQAGVAAKGAAGRAPVAALQEVARALPLAVSPRVEGLRRALTEMAQALQRLEAVPSLAALGEAEESPALQRLEEAAHYAARACAAARRRMGLATATPTPAVARALRDLEAAVDEALRGGRGAAALAAATRAVDVAARADLPPIIADAVNQAVARLARLPREAPAVAPAPDASAVATQDPRLRLPPWLPHNRIVGGFYLLRPIGSGAAGSVFVARRAEERHDENAETYALKVPSYDGQNARTLTEQEFLQVFRQEAGALLTLPPHPNLAGFVTFDAGARPKPILVMELVHGSSLERLLDKRELSMSTAFSVLDGIAAGLGAMHALGIGHLDVKPANIILRLPQGGSDSRLFRLDSLRPAPVLVDFGLAGRNIRPGCASPYYGAPEVWDSGVTAGSDWTPPTPADVYGFCCLAFELFTGRTLFQADTLPALIGCHFNHDGNPPGLERLRADRRLAPLAQILSTGLRPSPIERATIGEIRDAIRALAPGLERATWPLAA